MTTLRQRKSTAVGGMALLATLVLTLVVAATALATTPTPIHRAHDGVRGHYGVTAPPSSALTSFVSTSGNRSGSAGGSAPRSRVVGGPFGGRVVVTARGRVPVASGPTPSNAGWIFAGVAVASFLAWIFMYGALTRADRRRQQAEPAPVQGIARAPGASEGSERKAA